MKHILYGIALTVIAANLTVLTLSEIGVIDIAVDEKYTNRDIYNDVNSDINFVLSEIADAQYTLDRVHENTYGEICGYNCPY